MPDVDEEWARFEREVIAKDAKPRMLRVAAWAGGIGIAATIALLFVLNMGKGDMEELPLVAQQPQPVHVESTNADAIPEEESKSAKPANEQPQQRLVAYTELLLLPVQPMTECTTVAKSQPASLEAIKR